MALPRPAEGSAGVERLEKLKGALPHGLRRASHSLSSCGGNGQTRSVRFPSPTIDRSIDWLRALSTRFIGYMLELVYTHAYID
jgi:hypothetical protein